MSSNRVRHAQVARDLGKYAQIFLLLLRQISEKIKEAILIKLGKSNALMLYKDVL